MTYRLATLDLTGRGEPPAPVTALPALLDSPHVAEPAILNGGFRPHRGLYRFMQRDGLIGLRVPEGLTGAVRVGVRLRVDPQSDQRWRDRQERLAGRTDGDVDTTPSGLEQPRLVRIGVQGHVGGLVLLRSGDARSRWVLQRAVTVVRHEDFRHEGLVLISFDSPPTGERPGYADSLSWPLIGVCVDWLRIVPAAAAPPTLSTGAPGEGGWLPWLRDVGYATVNPGAGNRGVRIEVAPGPSVSRRRQRLPSRRTVVAGAEAWSSASGDLPVRLGHTRDGCVVSLPDLAEPAYLRLLGPDGAPVRGTVRMRASPLSD